MKEMKGQKSQTTERRETTRIRTLLILMVLKSLNIDQKEIKMRKTKMRRLKMETTRKMTRKRRIRRKKRKSLMLQRTLSIKTLWTSKKKESSNPSGKNIAMETGEKDLVKLLLQSIQRFQKLLKSFLSHQRRKLSTQNKSKSKTKSRVLPLHLMK